MATIVNNPGGGDSGGAGGWIVAIVVIIILVLLALFLFPNVFGLQEGEVDVIEPAPNGADAVPPIINNIINSTTTVDTTSTSTEE